MFDTSRGIRRALLAGSMLAPLGTFPALANPQGGQVTAGAASISGGSGSMVVQQTSNRAVINWQSFSTGAGEKLRFDLPSSQSAVLNRVTGAQMSSLMGSLSSNGQVYLLNPHGVVVGPNGTINTGGFVASTLNLSNDRFMQGGPQTFSGASTAGIVILGTVKADAGDVLLAATQIDNQGKLLAPDGRVMLSAGSELIYVPGQSSNIAVAAPPPADGAAVSNSGVIEAAQVQLSAAGSAYALAVNAGGQISATGVRNVGGHIVLDGGAGDVVAAGQIRAAGGEVSVTGGRVALTDGTIDVSAATGGGKATLSAERAIAVTAGAAIRADATAEGHGGTITVKTAGATQFAGTASAEGGAQGGDGGQAEISGSALDFTGAVSLRAPKGRMGTLLFDPTDITVVSGNAATPSGISSGLWAFATDSGASQTISVGAIATLLASSNLELQASNSLTFDTPGTGSFATLISNTSNTLTLSAPTITLNASISLPNGTLRFNWPDSLIGTYGTAQSVTSAASAAITVNTLNVAGNYTTLSLSGALTATTLSFTQPDFNANSISIANAGNAISAVSFYPSGTNNRAQTLDIESSSAMQVSGTFSLVQDLTLVAGGDLTLQSGFRIATANHTTILASTGGVFNNLAGATAIGTSNGTLRIYSYTNGTGASGTTFNEGGIASGATVTSGVTYPSNPNTIDTMVEYFATTSAQPTLTITANSFTRLYGDADPTFTASYSGGSGGGASELTTLPSFRILQGLDVNAGTYTIQPYGAASSVDLLRYVNGTLTVNPATLTITAQSASMTYGGTLPTFTSSTTGFVNGDTSSLLSGLSVTSNAGSAPGAGTYSITPSGATVATPAGGSQPNYTISYQSSTLRVTPAPLTVTAAAASTQYGSELPGFRFTFSGFVNDSDAASVPSQFAGVTTAVRGSGAGTYAITLASANPNANYSTTYVGADLTITKAPLTITPNLSKLYGAALPTSLPAADFAGLFSGDTPASLTTQPVLSFSATSSSVVGTYGVTASGAASPNYTITYAPGLLTVTPAPLTITALDRTRLYGAADPAFAASISGLVNGDAETVVSGLSFGTAATSASNVGTYAITPSGAAATNYTIRYVSGSLAVTPASLVLTPSGTSFYGADPVTTARVTYTASGFVNGDTMASLTTQPTLRTPATRADHVNFYPLFASGASSPNYTISYLPGTLRVQAAALIVTPNNASMMYGSAVPTVGYTLQGLVNGDSASQVFATPPSVVSPTAGLAVGTYAIRMQSLNSVNPDYVLAINTGTLTVTKAPLVITPNLTINQGQALPSELSPSAFAGLVNGDTPSTALVTQTALVVEGRIVTASNATSNNYDIAYRPGTLEVIVPLVTTKLDPLVVTSDLLAATTKKTDITVRTDLFGFTGGAYNEEQAIIGNFLEATKGSSTPMTETEFLTLLHTDPTTAQGIILPFFMDRVTAILNTPESEWTTDQRDFIGAFTGYIEQQRKAAAAQAKADYAAWQAEQQKEFNRKLNEVSGTAQVYMAAILASDPPQPPPELIAQINLGIALNADQAATAGAVLKASNAFLTGANTGATTLAQKQLDTLTALNPKDPSLPNLAKMLNSGDASLVATALKSIDRLYSGEVEVGRAPDASTLAGGATADIAKSAKIGMIIAENPGHASAVMSEKVLSMFSPSEGKAVAIQDGRVTAMEGRIQASNKKIVALQEQKALTNNADEASAIDTAIRQAQRVLERQTADLKGLKSAIGTATDTTDVLSDAVGDAIKTGANAGKNTAKLTGTAAKIAGVVGAASAVLEVLGNAVQIGMTSAAYADIATYNATFDKAVADAQKSVSTSDLKAMMGSSNGKQQMLGYMTAMMVSGSDNTIDSVHILK